MLKATLQGLVYYNGVWDKDLNYSNYKVKGIIIKEDINFQKLKEMIAGILKVNHWETELEMKYRLEDSYQILEVEDNDSLQFYIELKKKEMRVTKFPLCVTNKVCEEQWQSPEPESFNSATMIEGQSENMISSETTMDIVKYAEILGEQNSKEEEKAERTPEDISMVTEPSIKDIYVGQIFKDKKIMITSFCFYTIANHFQYKVSKSCPKEYIVNCLDDNCKWTVRASRDGKTSMFIVRRVNNIHICPPEIRMEDKRQATSSIIGEYIKTKFLDVKTIYTPSDIIADIQKDFGVILSYNRAWRSKGKALDQIRGNPCDSYSILPKFQHMLLQTNPGSVVDIQTTDGKFEYVFMALDASIKGWKYCRPVIVVDATFLKSTYRGMLLTASTQDGNGKIFPLAFAVVDSENHASWEYFFAKLLETFGRRAGLCIVSDRHDSISEAVKNIFPEASHGICAYHLLNNVKLKFGKKTNAKALRECFYGAAKSYSVQSFDYFMGQLDDINVAIRPYLEKIGVKKWARSHCKDNRFSTMTSNIAESMNAAIKAARELPVATLLEYLRFLTQKWTYTNRNAAICTMTKLTSKAENDLRDNYAISLRMKASTSVTNVHDVQDGEKTFIVKLREKNCTCGRFQIDEMPCPHTLAILSSLHLDPYQYCSKFFTKENLLAMYDGVVYPMPSQNNWDIPTEIERIEILPPIGKIPAGRPKKRRINGPAETVNPSKCGRCDQRGHNRKTCRNLPK
ncbi:uncharacterized protein LOC126659644 [Mercurialis annua]|uniref:uncharacterized protein LOC126659644 n=1 Tax=Mercurialis annua TaxID=3986 RepID=UPI002160718D|nr:uncharacterized protein LOC126659644 [Mercurialis annua]